jgi:hypothetical protein
MIVRVRREVPDQHDQRHRRDGGHRKYLPHLQSP